MNTLLSLCIPTYNRAEHLAGCLESLVPQLRPHNIPICISDNASTDNTSEIVNAFKKIYPHIYYLRQAKNAGFDANVERALKMSDTQYAWLLGDKVRIVEGAIDIIFKVLLRDKYDYVVVNAGKSTNINKRAVKDVKQQLIYDDPNELIKDLGWWITLVGATIWSKNAIKEGRFDQYSGTEYVHVGVIFDYLADLKFKVYWLPEPMIYGVGEMRHSGWLSSRAVEIFTKKWVDLIQSLPDRYTQEAKLKCIKDLPVKNKIFSLKGWLWLRGRGFYDSKAYQKYSDYFDYVTNVPKWVLLLINFIPKGLLAAIEKLYFMTIGSKT